MKDNKRGEKFKAPPAQQPEPPVNKRVLPGLKDRSKLVKHRRG